MSAPLWQFWTDWAVKAAGTLLTLLAVVVALFGSRLRHWITPPQLSITLSSAEGMVAWLLTEESPINGIWYHVRVVNETRETPVTGVHILLQLIEDEKAPEAGWEGSAPLGWRHEKNPLPKTIGYRDAEC